MDANAAALAEIAWRSGRKPSRGGVDNLLCLAGTPAEIAEPLAGLVDFVTVLLPWGSLLSGVAAPDEAMLRDLGAVCRSGASIEIVFSHEARDGILDVAPDEAHVRGALPVAYRRAGLLVERAEALDAAALRRYPTTWAQRLATGRGRRVWRILCAAQP